MSAPAEQTLVSRAATGAQARRRRTTMPRPARPIASTVREAGSGARTDVSATVRMPGPPLEPMDRLRTATVRFLPANYERGGYRMLHILIGFAARTIAHLRKLSVARTCGLS